MRAHQRFLEYIKYDTASDPDSESSPSSAKQLTLSERLAEELRAIGVADAELDEFGYVYGSIPASAGCGSKPAIGLCAHVDTSPDISGANVKARIVKNYDGGDVVLNEQQNIVMRPAEFSHMKKHYGQDLIVTDGTTLLGADDKAGVAEIMTAVETVLSNGAKHGRICVCFTPDEEIGRGVAHLDFKKFNPDFAFTLDGGDINKYAFETFNAASAVVKINGINIHPGDAKDKMRNAVLVAMEFNALLPSDQRPENTVGREGFFHIGSICGNEESCTMKYILRDHDAAKLESKKQTMRDVAAAINERRGKNSVELTLKDGYRNMREILDGHPEIIERIQKAMRDAGIESPQPEAVRGGTDGSEISFHGVPCPNLPTGGYNFHGRYEYISVQAMDTAVQIVLNVLRPE